jgi:hypothetical protein
VELRSARLGLIAVWIGVALYGGSTVRAQEDPTPNPKSKLTEQLSKVLTDPTEMEKAEKEKNRPPIEIFKASILPNEYIPFVKANHWASLALELRSNQMDFVGEFETQPVRLHDMPHEVVFRREARLVKGQRSRLLLQMMLPKVAKEIELRLARPDSLRPEVYAASTRMLPAHQMQVQILTKGPNAPYSSWNLMRCMFPASGQKSEPAVFDLQRYYRTILPSDPEKPQLPTHPLTWTTISHVIWDGMAPEILNVSQQEAMVDWLHWGGQLIIVGGASPNFVPLRESAFGVYLPALPGSQSRQLSADDLTAFANAYPPSAPTTEPDEPIEQTQTVDSAFEEHGRRYRDPVGLLIPKDKPLYVAGLDPKPGARVIGFGKPGLPPLGVEWRVGRGRVLMLGIGLTDPAMLGWAGYDTFVRRVVLRRPEEDLGEPFRWDMTRGGSYLPPRYNFLSGPDLTSVRLFGRDLGAPTRRIQLEEDDSSGGGSAPVTGKTAAVKAFGNSSVPTTPAGLASVYNPYEVPVAEWTDTSAMPTLSRQALEHASGIEIPGQRFVLLVIVAYMIALVPVNWLICRFAFGRREWAWAVVPLLAVGFAVAVERAAAYDVGYDSACNEIDVLETYGDYPRGHLSRFASLYTTGRVRYSISYPDDPSALALPLNTGRAIRGEDIQQTIFRTMPTPTLVDFQVQPRSLAMFRAEQFASLPGTVTLTEENGVRKVVNGTDVELRDAVVVEVAQKGSKAIFLGRIAPRATVEVVGEKTDASDFLAASPDSLKKNEVDPAPFLSRIVRASDAMRPEETGEVRLLAWVPKPQVGQVIEPAVDLHQGFTLMVAHLKMGSTPDPASYRYNILARGPERAPQSMRTSPPPVIQNNPIGFGRGRGGTAVMPRYVPPPPTGAMPAATLPGDEPVEAEKKDDPAKKDQAKETDRP